MIVEFSLKHGLRNQLIRIGIGRDQVKSGTRNYRLIRLGIRDKIIKSIDIGRDEPILGLKELEKKKLN